MTRKLHITETLAEYQPELRSMLNGGADPALTTLLSTVALPQAITFEGPSFEDRTFTHLRIDRILTGDAEMPDEDPAKIIVKPELAFMVSEADMYSGLVAQLDFQRFDTTPEGLAARWTVPLIAHPTYKNYSFYEGQPFAPMAGGIAVNNVTQEVGPAAMWAADIIQAGCEVMRTLGPGAPAGNRR